MDISRTFDLAIVGAGVIGLAHAYVGGARGQALAVIEKDTRANGASIRNFGFVTVTGPGTRRELAAGATHARLWADIACRRVCA